MLTPQGCQLATRACLSFAQAHYTEALLKKESPAQRANLHKKIADRFGTIAVNGIRREGPDAPLR